MRSGGRWGAVGVALSLVACGVDSDAEAPYVAPPTDTGDCGSTADLFPRLEAFVGAGRYEPLRQVVEANLMPSEANPAPDPSWRSVVDALLALIRQIGLDSTAIVATLAADGQVEDQISPVVEVVLAFLAGQLDGTPRYEVADASAFFVDRCDASYLLSSVEGVLRFESPSSAKPWLVAVLDALVPLLDNPTLRPFLESFERGGEAGRPAIVGVLRQIMSFVADDGFEISRVETLLASAVYPLVDQPLERDIERVVALFGEVTDPQQEVFLPLQQAMRCGMRHPEPRDVLLGFVYDLVAAPEVGLDRVLEGVSVLRLDVVVDQLELIADVVSVLRRDQKVQDELRALLILFTRQPVVEEVLPVLIDILHEDILLELLEAVVTVLEGCGRG